MFVFASYPGMAQRVVFFIMLFSASWFSHAETDLNELNSFFSHKTLKADFRQEILDQRRQLIQKMAGRIVIKRPGQFSWIYQYPYEQQIIADGKKVWLYDIDLEQVTVKAQDQTLGGTPAVLLSSQGNLDERFKVRRIQRNDELGWFELTPRNEDGSFEHLYLGVKNKIIQCLEIQDGFGQLTKLYFENVQINKAVSDDVFSFAIPEGVDVIDETANQ